MTIQIDKAAHFLAGMALAALLVPFVLWWSLLPVVLAGAISGGPWPAAWWQCWCIWR